VKCEFAVFKLEVNCGLISLLSFEPDRNANQTTTSDKKQKAQNNTAH